MPIERLFPLFPSRYILVTMNFTALLFAATMACMTVSTLPTPRYCWRKGQPCGKLKRATEIPSHPLNELSTNSSAETGYCLPDGTLCSSAKRAEIALISALADASYTKTTKDKGTGEALTASAIPRAMQHALRHVHA
jgi:hypothetical protein